MPLCPRPVTYYMSDIRADELLSSESFRPRRRRSTEFTQVVRFFNILLATTIVGFGIYWYFGFKSGGGATLLDDPSMLILPGYVALSGLIILGVEFNIRLVVRNMRFLHHYLGRGVFNIYVGLLCFALVTSGPLRSARSRTVSTRSACTPWAGCSPCWAPSTCSLRCSAAPGPRRSTSRTRGARGTPPPAT